MMARLDPIASKMQEFLTDAGVAPSSRTKIRNALAKFGIVDPKALQLYSPRELAQQINGLSEDAARLICDHAYAIFNHDNIFMSLDEIEELESQIVYLPTSSTKLDKILGGGVPTRAFIELYGLPQMGKTQFCLSVAVNTIKMGKAVIWIDTEGAFRSSRFLRLAQFRGLTREAVAPLLFVVTAKDLDKLKVAVNQTSRIFAEKDVGLLVIDSLMNPFRAEYSGLGDLGERQRELNRFLQRLKRLTEAYNMAVLYTNHVMAKIDPYAPGPSVIPVGGNVLGHASDIRIWMRLATRAEKGDSKALARTATIVDCGWLPEASATFAIGPFAIADLENAKSLEKDYENMFPATDVIR